MNATTFKNIQIGQTFEFVSNLNGHGRVSEDRTGVFVRLTTRKYGRHGGTPIRIIGSIEAPVRAIESVIQ